MKNIDEKVASTIAIALQSLSHKLRMAVINNDYFITSIIVHDSGEIPVNGVHQSKRNITVIDAEHKMSHYLNRPQAFADQSMKSYNELNCGYQWFNIK